MTTKKIAVFLKQARENMGYSRNRVGELSELHPDTVRAIESGENGYNIKALIAYCDVVKVKISFEENAF